VFKGRVSGQYRVVRFDDRAGQLGGRIDTEFQFRLLPVVGREALKKKSAKARASPAAEGVEDEEALKTGTVVREATKLVHDGVNELLSDGVMAASVCEQ
jgi:hypothetical protein